MKIKRLIKIYSLLALTAAIIITLLRSLSLLNSYDIATGYFNASPIFLATKIITVATALGCAAPLFLIPKNAISAKLTPSSRPMRFASCYSAIITLLATVATLPFYSSGKLAVLTIVSLGLSALFFVFFAIGRRNHEICKAFFAISVIACCVFILASLYFNLSIAMNSPHKIYGSFALMSAMFLMLFEIRIYLKKPMPRLHLAFSALTFVLGFSLSASSIIFRLISHSSEFVASPILLGNIGYVLFIAAMSLFAIARCFTFDIKEDAEFDSSGLED